MSAWQNWVCAVVDAPASKVALRLKEQFTDVLFPQEIEVKRRHGKRIDVKQPLFGGYVFVLIGSSWRRIIDVRGVRGVLMCGANPEYVPSEVIRDIRLNLDSDDMLKSKQEARFVLGQPVTFKGGPFAGQTGTFLGLDNRKSEVAWFGAFRVVRPIGELIPIEQ